MNSEKLISWLLTGDVSIQYQTQRDLLDTPRPDLQQRIASEGWGFRFLQARNASGHWGQRFYQPKWISSHYTLLDMKHLGFPRQHPKIDATLALILDENKGPDGGVLPIGTTKRSDVCVNGMLLNYACYFRVDPGKLESIIDFLTTQHMTDGGFNCQLNRQGATHSSLHSTISVLEGFQEYRANGYSYRLAEVEAMAAAGREFILLHRLYRSDRTGEIIHPQFLRLPYPSRWKYDILRALVYFQMAGIPYDARMQDALDLLCQKRKKDGTWTVQAKHPGQTHFDMEKAGQSSRWNTLRALRVLRHFRIDPDQKG